MFSSSVFYLHVFIILRDPPEIREKIKQRIENPEAYEKEIQKKMERKLKTVEKRKKHQQQKMKTEESNEVQPYMVHVYR